MLAMIGSTTIDQGTSPNTKYISENTEVTEIRPRAVYRVSFSNSFD